MLEPIVRSIEVPCGQAMAFRVFVEEMAAWWPLAEFSSSAMTGQAAARLRVEAKPGGRIVETGPDGAEHLWGSIVAYEPHGFLSMDFHIPHPTETVKERSLVELRFTALGERLTRVDLTQSRWEAFGKRAKTLQSGYGSGWAVIFDDAYKCACFERSVASLAPTSSTAKESTMKRFMLLHYGFEKPTPKIMEAWMAWFGSIAGISEGSGAQFGPGSELGKSGVKGLNQPMDRESITGYNIIKAESLEAAVKIAKKCPSISCIRVYEIMTH